jgi:hypothetical protein
MSGLIETRPAVLRLENVDGPTVRLTERAALCSEHRKGRPMMDTLQGDTHAFRHAYPAYLAEYLQKRKKFHVNSQEKLKPSLHARHIFPANFGVFQNNLRQKEFLLGLPHN